MTYNRRRGAGDSNTVTVRLVGRGTVRVMTLRYGGECAGYSRGDHVGDCPRDLAAGVRAVYDRPEILSLECADKLAPARWHGSPVSGRYVSGLLGRPITEGE